ncbi:sister chromatid cohesion protein Dcc1 [Circinella umbellata]|nr:sister chromatid cohesion protein Dcc1 [Circinella umbellata]
MPELIYSNDFHKGTYSLIELSNDKIAEAIESSGELVIKGLPEDEAVLCTHDQTFSLRQVNTSNSLLLARKELSNDSILHVIDDLSHTIEVIPCLARLTRIDDLLQPTKYAGEAVEHKNANKEQYSYQELLSIIQASEAELRQGLSERNAFELNGKYRILERSFMHGLLDALITNATIAELNLDAMPLEAAKDCIRQYHEDGVNIPDPVVMACLKAFSTTSDNIDNDGELILKLDQYKVCRFMGEVILASARGKEWTLDDFHQVWRRLVPDVFTPNMEQMLQGLYITTERAAPGLGRIQSYVSYFPVTELSVDPAQRFASLFAEKKQWTPEQIIPYIQDLASTPKARDALLLKFTRTQKSNGQVLYGSRIK